MAKRGATSELNHDNWDREEPPEKAGMFQKASNDVMQKRIVKVAKRRSAGLSDQEATKNVFSGFQGFKSDSASKASADLSSTSSFLANNPLSSTVNGITNQSQLSMSTTVSSSTNNILSSDASTAGAPNSKMITLNAGSSSGKYPAKLIRLNQSVAEWIKSHVDKDPSCILTPIFRDYERYLKEIEDERNRNTGDKKDNNFAQTNLISSSNISASSSFKFNQPNDTGSVSSNSENKLSSPAGGSSTSPVHSLFSSFKSTSSSKSVGTSSLLCKPDPASLMINPFTTALKKPQDDSAQSTNEANKAKVSDGVFKMPQESTSTTTGGFSFGSGKMLSFGSTTGQLSSESSGKNSSTDNDGGGDAEESDEPPKADFKPVQEEDALFNKRCKVFIKKENNYADLGVGTLFIKPVPGEKHQLLVRADTSLGNILVNVLLTSAIPTQRMGKNNVMIICVPTPPATGTTQPAPSTVLLRVKTAEEADELLKVLEKYKK